MCESKNNVIRSDQFTSKESMAKQKTILLMEFRSNFIMVQSNELFQVIRVWCQIRKRTKEKQNNGEPTSIVHVQGACNQRTSTGR